MRESLFGILGDLTGRSFLDLFSGSGAIAIEAASRGASPVVLIEKDRRKKRTLLENLAVVKSEKELHLTPVDHYLRRARTPFDYIFLDPPFAMPEKIGMIRTILTHRRLKAGGKVILHLPREERAEEELDMLRLFRRERYGRSVLLFYELRAIASPPL
jgi:16S rRNA (guanine(966)-N(2))-methyltransferase RsmD